MRKGNMKRIMAAGFTLVEMLLVMVIIGIIMFAGIRYVEQRTLQMRIDRSSLQIQQILNAGLAYYVNNSTWPTSLACLEAQHSSGCTTQYLPTTLVNNPWGSPYQVASTGQLFYAYAQVTQSATDTKSGSAMAAAQSIAGELPLAYTSSDSSGAPPQQGTACTVAAGCYVAAAVTIPGQNLNNAGAVNFAGLYHEGACVPVPTCPVDQNGNNMVPEIMVVPASVSGLNDPSPSSNVYPISSFTGFATTNNTGATPDTPTNAEPPACDAAAGSNTACYSSNGTQITSGSYWRVCLQVITEAGDVSLTNTSTGSNAWGQYVTLMAVTRCAPGNENSGSNFTVFTQ